MFISGTTWRFSGNFRFLYRSITCIYNCKLIKSRPLFYGGSSLFLLVSYYFDSLGESGSYYLFYMKTLISADESLSRNILQLFSNLTHQNISLIFSYIINELMRNFTKEHDFFKNLRQLYELNPSGNILNTQEISFIFIIKLISQSNTV